MTYIIIAIVIVSLVVLIMLKETIDERNYLNKLLAKADVGFGKLSEKKLSLDDLENCKSVFYRYREDSSVDDITASDLELDEIFERFNNTISEPGEEYFYYTLRNPVHNNELLKDLNNKVEEVRDNRELRLKIQTALLRIGGLKKANFLDCIDLFSDISEKSVLPEIVSIIGIIVAIILTVINPSAFVLLLIGILIFNIISYYSQRGKIEAYMVCLNYVLSFVAESKQFANIDNEVLSMEAHEFKRLYNSLCRLIKHRGLLAGGRAIGTGNPFDMLGDYLKMFFHLDIIKFYRTIKLITDNKDDIVSLYLLIGRLETYITIASMREYLCDYCIPESGKGIEGINMYHPLIKNPVKNSIFAKKGVLITGSNASGKSTFLKTVALNAIFAQTIYTCTADTFKMDDYYVFSSMSLRDDILNEDSYFMVEIKALRRIFKFIEDNPDKKVLCFVDEVLRGTNTIERIAACTKILENLSEGDTLVFAATHDIELTDLLAARMSNYHFDETIENNDILFNYMIKEGKATSKNAIKLLAIMGFSPVIVDNAQKMADEFIYSNVWKN